MKRINHPAIASIIIMIVALFAFGVLCTGQTDVNTGNNGLHRMPLYVYPLKLTANSSHFLTDQNNRPFFWSGDAGWSLIAQLSKEDVDFYLDNRKEKGFSVIMVSLIEHKFCNNPPANHYGNLPFTGKIFTTPDENYFAHADYVIKAAEQRNIIVLLAPLYLGYDCKDEGWCAEVKAASINDLYLWGRYIGNRYKNFKNIIWLIGGDTDPLQVKEKVLDMVRGIHDFDTLHLITAHNNPESMACTPWPDKSWLSVNNVYSYDSAIYKHYKEACLKTPAMPYFEIESTYENEHNSIPQQVRSQAYQAVLSGAMGHIFGNCPVWHFGAAKTWCNMIDWKTELNNSGSLNMAYLQRLFTSRAWNILIPDFEHKVLNSGYGSWGTKDYVTCAITSDGNTMIAYLPSARKVSVDMSKISGSKAKCWLYDPATGNAILIGTFKNAGIQSFIPGSKGDWILVIDNSAKDLPAPGSQTIVNQALK
jgi:Protein of unknown function (DUF4038)/Putative collagen-binding domain of a collagenase